MTAAATLQARVVIEPRPSALGDNPVGLVDAPAPGVVIEPHPSRLGDWSATSADTTKTRRRN